MLVEHGISLLIDVTRHFGEQARWLDGVDAILLTHAHRDASGGLGRLRAWWQRMGMEAPLPVYAHRDTIAAVRRRFGRLDQCRFVEASPGVARRLGGWSVTPLEVPHALERRYPTYAWRLRDRARTVVYASDVATLTPELRRFARGASVLVIDGAMWGRRLFSHLTIDAELPALCEWKVDTILLTQIGKTAPPHRELERAVAALCRRARPAYDGLSLELA